MVVCSLRLVGAPLLFVALAVDELVFGVHAEGVLSSVDVEPDGGAMMGIADAMAGQQEQS